MLFELFVPIYKKGSEEHFSWSSRLFYKQICMYYPITQAVALSNVMLFEWQQKYKLIMIYSCSVVFNLFFISDTQFRNDIVEDVAKISTNKLITFDFFNFYFTTCLDPKQGPLQVSLHFELILTITKQNN